MAELLSSKVIISEEEPTIRSFPVLPSAVLAILGVAEKGPVATPQLITSFEEYQKYFGGYLDGYQMPLAVRSFFLNGGLQAYISRVVHYTDPAVPGSKTSAAGTVTLQTGLVADGPASHTGTNTETFDLEPGDTFIGNVEGIGNQTATVTATAASEESGSAETFDFSLAPYTLTVKINQGSVQTITFQTSDFGTPAAATAEEIAQVINAQIYGAKAKVTTGGTKVTIESDRRGTGSYVEITGGTANSGTPNLAFPTAEVQGTGNVANVDAATATEVAAMIQAAWTNGSGVTGTVVSGAVKISTVAVGAAVTLEIGAGTGNTVVGFTPGTYNGSGAAAVDTLKVDGKYDGEYANSLLVRISTATSGEAEEFNLYIINASGVVLESFPNLTMDDTATRFVETIVNSLDFGSTLVSVTDLDAGGGTPTDDRPANTSGATITGGLDGLSLLDYNDFIGDQAAATGLYAFDLSDDITILACPDNVTASLQKAMIYYCEAERKGMVFAILDPGVNLDTTGIISQLTGLGSEGNTEYAAMYWPRVKIINPSKPIYGEVETVTMAPSGMLAGIMANNDNEEPEGPFFHPAGVEGGKPYGIVDLERDDAKLESKRDLIYPKRINPITYLRGYGVFVDGSRTLKGDGNFPSIGERRGVSHIERLMENGLQWVRHRNNTPALRRAVEKTVYAELHSWMRRGAFATNDPATAFFVDVSDALNPPSVVRAGKLVMRIGLATSSPAEFLIIKVTKDTRALDEELFGQG